MPEVTMPRLSDSMEEGTIIRWLKTDGEEVTRGEELVEIETDKATMAFESDFSGTLAIVAPAGTSVPVGEPIAQVGEPTAPAGETRPSTPAPGATSAGNGTSTPAANPAPQPASTGSVVVASPPGPMTGGVLRASPLARRIARGLGVELTTVTGSGRFGRILKVDVVAAAQAPPAASAPIAVPVGAADERQALTRTQSLIARRMVQSRTTVPEFALEVEVDMTAVLEMRAQLKALADPAPSLNDIIVKACAIALRRHPRANGSFGDDCFILHPRVNVAIAVASDDALVAPVVFDADTKTVGAIARDTRQLIERARTGTITPADLDGATFTVSNLGMFGIDRFEGIITAPQSAILCVGAVRDQPVAYEKQVAIHPLTSLTLAADHRILYGADAARFLVEVRDLLQSPVSMVL